MSNKLEKLFAELHKIENKASVQALASAPLARPLPSTAGNSLFGKTADLQATIAKIRAIESNSPSLKKYSAPKMPTGNLCSKTDLLNAQKHLASITATAPRKRFAALDRPAAAKAVTSPAKAVTGRNAAELLALDPDAQNKLIYSAMPLAARPLRDELRNAFKSAPPSLRTKFAAVFRNALNAHERDLGPSITKAQFDELTPQQKMDTAKAGIKISN
jgi:hypothetical protein